MTPKPNRIEFYRILPSFTEFYRVFFCEAVEAAAFDIAAYRVD